MGGGAYRVRGSFENGDFTYDFSGMKSHHFEIWVAVRIGFAEVLKIVTLHTISAA